MTISNSLHVSSYLQNHFPLFKMIVYNPREILGETELGLVSLATTPFRELSETRCLLAMNKQFIENDLIEMLSGKDQDSCAFRPSAEADLGY